MLIYNRIQQYAIGSLLKNRKEMVGKHTSQVQVAKFARAFVKNGGNATQAALETKPVKYNSARQLGHHLLKREDVKQAIIQALADTGIDYKYVLSAHKQFIDKGLKQLNGKRTETEPFISPSDTNKHLQGVFNVMRVLEGDGKTPDSNASQHVHLHLENATVKEVIHKRNELSGWFNGILDGEKIDESNNSHD
jgi:hypothetical protein